MYMWIWPSKAAAGCTHRATRNQSPDVYVKDAFVHNFYILLSIAINYVDLAQFEMRVIRSIEMDYW